MGEERGLKGDATSSACDQTTPNEREVRERCGGETVGQIRYC
jgi:hypothetical protein